MKRRVGLIQVLLYETEFLVVDEPTTGLNLIFWQNFLKIVWCFFSAHIVEDLAVTWNELAVMRKGSFLIPEI